MKEIFKECLKSPSFAQTLLHLTNSVLSGSCRSSLFSAFERDIEHDHFILSLLFLVLLLGLLWQWPKASQMHKVDITQDALKLLIYKAGIQENLVSLYYEILSSSPFAWVAFVEIKLSTHLKICCFKNLIICFKIALYQLRDNKITREIKFKMKMYANFNSRCKCTTISYSSIVTFIIVAVSFP